MENEETGRDRKPSTEDFREWLALRCGELTAKQYQNNIRQLVQRFGANILDIGDDDLEEFVRFGLGESKNPSKSSCVARRAALKMFAKWLKKVHGVEGWGEKLEEVDMGRAKFRIPDCMTQQEIDAMLKTAAHPIEYCKVAVMYSCGLRARELTGLTYGDVNLEDCELTVVGKGDKQRKCYLSNMAADALKELLSERAAWSLDDLLFTNDKGERISDQCLGYWFKTLAKKAGIKRNIHPHMMRHSFATKLMRNGVDIMTIKEMMGHSSIGTTQVYLTVADDAKKRAMQKTFNTTL